MSTSSRKLGFYGIEFKKNRKDQYFFDGVVFCRLLEYIKSTKTGKEKTKKNVKTQKALSLDSYENYEKQEMQFIKIIFKNCKYNHSPKYMSSEDGSERDSDKQLPEGDKEMTHLLCRVQDDELEVIIEERRSGAYLSSIVKYLNEFLKEYLDINDIHPQYKIAYSAVAMDDFEAAIDSLNRVCNAEIIIHKRLLGAEGLKLMDRADYSMKNEVSLNCKVKKGESLDKRFIKQVFRSITAEGESVSRIRIRGKDEHNHNIFVESDFIRRVENIDADIVESTGTVDSYSIFSKMEDIYGVDE